MSSKTKASDRREAEAKIAGFLSEKAQEQQLKNVDCKNHAISTALARDQLFLDHFKEVSKKLFSKPIQVKPYQSKKDKTKERIVNVMLSDMHYRSMLDPREVPLAYGPVEEARRTAAIMVEAADFKRQYRDHSKCYVHALGDAFEGQLHDLRDGAPLAEQVCTATYLLVQAITYLSTQFPTVDMFCSPGNHGRNLQRHPSKAVGQKWDSIETILYYAVKMAVATLPNVRVHIPYTPYYTINAFDKKGFFTHGDTVLNPGLPGTTINVASIRKQINEWNSSFALKSKHDLFATGHVHVGSMVRLPNGTTFMSNGALLPASPYSMSIGYPDAACGQWVWESVKGHIVGDTRFLTLDEGIDKDKSLDRVIKPFKGF